MAVILFDPDPEIAASVGGRIRGLGHDVAAFHDAEPAFGAIRERAEIDLAIVGIAGEGIEGLGLIFQIRSLIAGGRAMSIVAMLEEGARRTLIEVMDNADDCIGRPPLSAELVSALRSSQQLAVLQAALLGLADTDPVTGIFNRRRLDEAAAALRIDIAAPAAVALIDIDGFAALNARFGRDAGDMALIAVARLTMTAYGIAARLDNDAFALLLPGSSVSAAEIIADGVRRMLPSQRPEGVTSPITVSCGVAGWAPGEDFGVALARAEAALNAARAAGGDRVMRAADEAPLSPRTAMAY